ncbi:MAG: tetratricopeptide repeat protein [Pseudomonadota bacterium]
MELSRTVIVLISLCIGAPARALAPTELFAQASPAVAILETFNELGQRLGAYSATVVEPGRLVTMCNVLETAATLRVTLPSNSADAQVMARDRERNLCLISAAGLAAPTALPRLTEPLSVGSRVFALSNALGLGVGISEGVVSGIRPSAAGSYVQFSAPISPGSEGGALVDDSGRLVGIIDYRRRDGQNVNFASAAQWIDEIAPRAAAGDARLKRFDQAMALWKQQQWADLHAMASAWSHEEPQAKDAWRFVIAAAQGQGDAHAEVQGWQTLYQLDPSSSDVGTALGRLLLAGGKTPQALELAQQLLAGHQEDAPCWLFLGQVLQASGQPGEAEQAYRRALELDPWLIDAYRSMAMLAQMRGDSQTALAVWQRLSGLYPHQLGPRLGLVRAYLAAEKPARAWSELGQVNDSDTDNALVWYWKGVTLARLGCPEQAIKAYRASLDRQLDSADWAWAGIGWALADLLRHAEAIEAFRSAVQAAPEHDEWRYQLALQLKEGGRLDEALEITTELVTKSPQEFKNWRQHGFVLASQGRPEQALPAMEKSLQIESRQPALWRTLIETYQLAGRRDDAKRAYVQLRGIDSAMAEAAYGTTLLLDKEKLP